MDVAFDVDQAALDFHVWPAGVDGFQGAFRAVGGDDVGLGELIE